MVKLPDGNWVNPAHVTCIEFVETPVGTKFFPKTRLWVKKNAGYGTGSFDFDGDIRDKLAKLINGKEA
jgi:hypothetical protein